MRATYLLLCVALVLLASCSKSPTAPKVAGDPYEPMYGTWVGRLGAWYLRPGYPSEFADSAMMVISPGSSGPTMRLWQKSGQWHEVETTQFQWSGYWNGTDDYEAGNLTFDSSADTAGSRLAGHWLGSPWPYTHPSLPSAVNFFITWPGMPDSTGDGTLHKL